LFRDSAVTDRRSLFAVRKLSSVSHSDLNPARIVNRRFDGKAMLFVAKTLSLFLCPRSGNTRGQIAAVLARSRRLTPVRVENSATGRRTLRQVSFALRCRPQACDSSGRIPTIKAGARRASPVSGPVFVHDAGSSVISFSGYALVVPQRR
jgi:hypothetical protein